MVKYTTAAKARLPSDCEKRSRLPKRYTNMRILTFILLWASSFAYADCNDLVHDGGWSVDGSPGVVEITFGNDNTFSLHAIYAKGVESLSGVWKCEKDMINLILKNKPYSANLQSFAKNNTHNLIFTESTNKLLSNRTLRPFGI